MQLSWSVILFIAALLAISGCTKGNVLTGNTAADQPTTEAPSTPEPSETPVAQVETDTDSEEDAPPVLTDDTPPDYSSLKGTCTADSSGTVRSIDENGQKTVYRKECLADKLVEYSCEGGQVKTKLTPCTKGCVIENYLGKCA